VSIRTLIFLALAALVILASGCARSQIAPFAPGSAAPAIGSESAPTLAASPTNEPENLAAPVTSEGAARENLLAPVQATGLPGGAPAATPLATATRSRLPSPVSDLLYLSQGNLFRWDPLTRHAITLAQNVTAFAVSADGQVIVLLRPHKITSNGAQRFDLDALQLQSQQISTLTVIASQPGKILVSPDGSQVAFTQQQAGGSAIILLPIEPQSQPRKLGVCQMKTTAECTSIAWSPNSHELIWSDELGLWQAVTTAMNIADDGPIEATLVHPDTVQVDDPKGNPLEIKARFSELQFAPTERFILLTVTPVASQVGWQAVFDRRSGQLAQATDTFATSEALVEAIWQSNGDLLVAHASDPGQQISPFIHIWLVMPTNPELLVSGQQYDLYSDEFPFSAAESKSIPAHCLLWPAQTQPGHLAFAVRLDSSDKPPVLFDLNLLNGSLTRLYELPADTTRLLWAPDGVNALVQGGRNQISWLSLKSGEITQLQTILGPDANQFVWLPPVLRR
jgi:hypothetical protein